PNIDSLPDELEARDNVTLTEVNEAVHAADIVLLLVDHTEFTRLDRTLLTQKIVHDTRGEWGLGTGPLAWIFHVISRITGHSNQRDYGWATRSVAAAWCASFA